MRKGQSEPGALERDFLLTLKGGKIESQKLKSSDFAYSSSEQVQKSSSVSTLKACVITGTNLASPELNAEGVTCAHHKPSGLESDGGTWGFT